MAMACRMPNQIVPPGTTQMLPIVTTAAPAATLANRVQKAGQRMPCPCLGHEMSEQRLRRFRGRSGAEAGAGALARISGQCELRHEQQPASHPYERAVHAALVVGEHPIAEHAFQQARRRGRAVGRLDADEREQAVFDATGNPLPDRHLREVDALNEGDHLCPIVPSARPAGKRRWQFPCAPR